MNICQTISILHLPAASSNLSCLIIFNAFCFFSLSVKTLLSTQINYEIPIFCLVSILRSLPFEWNLACTICWTVWDLIILCAYPLASKSAWYYMGYIEHEPPSRWVFACFVISLCLLLLSQTRGNDSPTLLIILKVSHRLRFERLCWEYTLNIHKHPRGISQWVGSVFFWPFFITWGTAWAQPPWEYLVGGL